MWVDEVYAAGVEPVDGVLLLFTELVGGGVTKFGSAAPQTVQTPLEKLWAPVAGSSVTLITVPQAVQVTVSEPAAPQVGSTRETLVLLWGHWVGAGVETDGVLELPPEEVPPPDEVPPEVSGVGEGLGDGLGLGEGLGDGVGSASFWRKWAVMNTPLASASPGTVKRMVSCWSIKPMLALQWENSQPSSATAVISLVCWPFFTLWLVSPTMWPPSLAEISTGTLGPRNPMGSWVMRPGVTPLILGMSFRGFGRVSSVM